MPDLRLLRPLLDVVAPRSCAGCGCRGHALWCPTCDRAAEALRWIGARPRLPGLRRVDVWLRYQGPVADLVLTAKLGGRHDLWRPLGRRLVLPVEVDVVVPVPTEPRRRRARGFDHTALLAESAAGVAGVPALAAVGARRGAADRGLANAAGADHDEPGEPWIVRRRLDGARVVVVDDIVTTGATLVGVAAACRRAGAAEVRASVVAATPR